jgi:hypothetical protein
MSNMVVDARIYDYRGSQFVTAQGRVVTRFSEQASVNALNMQLRGKIDLLNLQQFLPLESAARMQVVILQQMGYPVSEHFFRSNIDAFVKQYNLCSAICISEGSDGKLHWVTKNGLALEGLFPELEGAAEQRDFTKRLKDIQPTFAEIEKGSFKAVQISTRKNGYHLESVTIPATAKLLPYFILHSFAGKLIRTLQEDETTVISYRRSRRVERVTTSLNPAVLRQKFDPALVKRGISQMSWHRGADLGIFHLPNLETGEYTRIPLHKICHIAIPQ